MFNSSYMEQNTSIKNEIAYKDRYPSVIINVKKFDILDIERNSDIFFLMGEAKQVIINENVRFILHKDLTGLIQKGKFRFWYTTPDRFNRYVKLLMLEGE